MILGKTIVLLFTTFFLLIIVQLIFYLILRSIRFFKKKNIFKKIQVGPNYKEMHYYTDEYFDIQPEFLIPIHGIQLIIKKFHNSFSILSSNKILIDLSKVYVRKLEIDSFIKDNLSEEAKKNLIDKCKFDFSIFKELDYNNVYYPLIIRLFLELKNTIKTYKDYVANGKSKIVKEVDESIIEFLNFYEKVYLNKNKNLSKEEEFMLDNLNKYKLLVKDIEENISIHK
ncbi:TPA: hypothetical protein KRH38_003227 [Clostridioides difficile]|uniref:hypothetical protein n=1 Tax=Clostridioides difficile TaxID=1496 RepID=UPI001C1C282B|nr:hypothetical protein [Clostridioides difficile]